MMSPFGANRLSEAPGAIVCVLRERRSISVSPPTIQRPPGENDGRRARNEMSPFDSPVASEKNECMQLDGSFCPQCETKISVSWGSKRTLSNGEPSRGDGSIAGGK